jgi:kynurenine formamidase
LGSGVSGDRRDSGHICGSTACGDFYRRTTKKDDNYHLQVADIENWEAEHGRIPEGSVVFVRSDWSKRWPDPALAKMKRFPGVSLAALKFLHEQRKILFHGHEPLDTDSTPTLEGEEWSSAYCRSFVSPREGTWGRARTERMGA